MATKIVTKNSSTASAVPTASDLVQGELAVNVADKRLFTEDNAGAIVELGTNPSGNVTFQDNGKAIFGAGSDLQIYHDGSNSYIDDVATGHLFIRSNGDGIYLRSNTNEEIAHFNVNGSVKAYYDNSLKLATTTTGIDVTGTATAKSLVLGSPNYIGDYDTGVFRQINIGEGGNVATFFGQDNGSAGGIISNAVLNASSQIIYSNSTDEISRLYLYDGTFVFSNAPSGTAGAVATPVERLRIDASGNVGIGESSPSGLLHLRKASDTADIILESSGGSGKEYLIGSRTDGSLNFYDVTASTERMRIDSSGNLGIGKTPDTNFGGYVLQLNGGSQTFMSFGNSTVGTTLSDGLVIGCDSTGADIYQREAQPLRFHTSNTERMRIDSSGNVGIGTSSPQKTLDVKGTFAISNSTTSYWDFDRDDSDGSLKIADTGIERMRIDSSGNLLVGNTITNPASGFSTQRGFGYTSSTGKVEIATTANDAVMELGKNNANDGNILVFRKQSTTVGSIGSSATGGGSLVIGNASSGIMFRTDLTGSAFIPANPTTGTQVDNQLDIGHSVIRFDDVYATNGTIQTSDRNEKQDIAELSDAEQRVAVAAKGLLRKFRWKDSVAEKGDEARVHFGIIAQDLQAAFAAEGLDAGDYAMFISTTWTDEETNEEKTRMGVRYSELLAFIIAAI